MSRMYVTAFHFLKRNFHVVFQNFAISIILFFSLKTSILHTKYKRISILTFVEYGLAILFIIGPRNSENRPWPKQ